MRRLGVVGLVAAVACSRSELDTPASSAPTAPVDPATFVTGTCSSWSIGAAQSIGPPDDVLGTLMGAAPAGDGALVGWMASQRAFGVQLLHVDSHGLQDEPLPVVVSAPYQPTQQFQVAFSLANSHGHLGVSRYEERLGYAFTPVDVHGAASGPEVQLAPAPNDGFAHDTGLYATPTGFLEMDPEGGPSAVASLLDFTGSVQAHASPTSLLPPTTLSSATVLDDATIVAFGVQHDAPAITDQVTGAPSMRVLDANAESVFPSLFVATVDGLPLVTTGVTSGMSVTRLQADGAPVGAPAAFQPTDGNCATVAYAHGAIVCATTRAQAVDVEVFGFDGTPRSSLLTASLPTTSVLVATDVTMVVATRTGALVFVEPALDGRPQAFSVELTCVP